MTFLETRVKIDKLLEEAEAIKDGSSPEKMQEKIEELRPMLEKLIEFSDPNSKIQERVCGNRRINIANLETVLAKSRAKAIKAAAKKTKKKVEE